MPYSTIWKCELTSTLEKRVVWRPSVRSERVHTLVSLHSIALELLGKVSEARIFEVPIRKLRKLPSISTVLRVNSSVSMEIKQYQLQLQLQLLAISVIHRLQEIKGVGKGAKS